MMHWIASGRLLPTHFSSQNFSDVQLLRYFPLQCGTNLELAFMSFGKVEFHHDDNRVNIAGAMRASWDSERRSCSDRLGLSVPIMNHSLSI